MIRFENVRVTYDGAPRTALVTPRIQVPEGDLVLVAGPTGSGKSTLLRAVNGLVPHFSGGRLEGRVLVDGRDTREHRPRDLADVVGFVGQDPLSSFVTETVEEEIAYGMETLAIGPTTMRRRVEESLDVLGVADLRTRPLHELSGGQQQRVAVAAVLAAGPRVLVMDEPTSSLDPVSAEDVLAAVHRLVHDLGVTVLMAEHRLERVIHHADRILLVQEGVVSDLLAPSVAMQHSPVAPPVVRLGRRLGWDPLPLSIRDARRRVTVEGHAPTSDPADRSQGQGEPRTSAETGNHPDHSNHPNHLSTDAHGESRTSPDTGNHPNHPNPTNHLPSDAHGESRTDAETGDHPNHLPTDAHGESRTSAETGDGRRGMDGPGGSSMAAAGAPGAGRRHRAEGRPAPAVPERSAKTRAQSGRAQSGKVWSGRAWRPKRRAETPAEEPRAVATASVETSRLHVRRRGLTALGALEVTFPAGRVTALMGRNGAGKSTLLGCLSGLVRPTSGTVTVDGLDPSRTSPRDLLGHVGMVPQDARTILYHSTIEAECAAADRDVDVERGTTLALLERLAGAPPEEMHPRDLSEGGRVLLALAVILVGRPRVLLLDEPTRGLDYGAKARLGELLREQASAGRAVVVATHDVELAAEFADDVALLADGELIGHGAAREILCGSPAFAPQIAKIMHPLPYLTVDEVPASTPRSGAPR